LSSPEAQHSAAKEHPLFDGTNTLCKVTSNYVQVWYQRAIVAKKENLRKFVDDMAAKGSNGAWAFSHDMINTMHQASSHRSFIHCLLLVLQQ